MRNFDTGATRNSNDHKYVYNGFNSALVEKSFAEYMHSHREQADGTLRPADNWKKGIPKEAYLESLHRHYVDLWELMETGEETLVDADGHTVDKIHLLNAIRFNVNGLIFEHIKEKLEGGTDLGYADLYDTTFQFNKKTGQIEPYDGERL